MLFGNLCSTSHADIILRIESDTVTAGASAVLGVFLDDDGSGTSGNGLNLDSFSIPLLLDGLTAAATPASNGLFGEQAFAVVAHGQPADPFFSDLSIGQEAGSGAVQTGASSKLFDLTINTAMGDVGSHTININPASIFFQLELEPTGFATPDQVLAGTLTVNSAAVPEPGSFLILLAGAAGFVVLKRRRLNT